MTTTTYREASPVKRIADKLIPQHHKDLSPFTDTIRYVFRSEAAKSGGKLVYGKARVLSGLNAFLALDLGESGSDCDQFFVIEIAEDQWALLSDAQRAALVDHELSHCVIEYDEKTGDPKLKLRAHDLEEFVAIVQRHGLWRPEIEHMVKVGAEQLTLTGD